MFYFFIDIYSMRFVNKISGNGMDGMKLDIEKVTS